MRPARPLVVGDHLGGHHAAADARSAVLHRDHHAGDEDRAPLEVRVIRAVALRSLEERGCGGAQRLEPADVAVDAVGSAAELVDRAIVRGDERAHLVFVDLPFEAERENPSGATTIDAPRHGWTVPPRYERRQDGSARLKTRTECASVMIPSRYLDSPAARAAHGDRVDRLAPFLTKADPLADDVVRDVIRGLPPGQGWAQIERVLRDGVANVPDAHPAVRALFESVEHVPAWVDWKVIDRAGSLLLRTGWFGGLVLGIQSLPYGYASPGGNKPLAFSGRLREQAPRRLTETARFVHTVCLPGEVHPGREGFSITLKVRLMHAQVRRLLWDSGKWNRDAWGEPINQHDMAATTMLFSIVVLDGIRKLGFRVSRDEAEDYVQLWRYVGWLMGSSEELLPTSEREAHRLADLIMATQAPPDDDARALTKALLDSGRQAARTEDELRQVERLKYFTLAVSWRLLGAELASQLAVPRSPLEPLFPLLRGAIGAVERVRRLSPRLTSIAVRQGDVYWKKLIDDGLRGKPADFHPPTSLAGRTATA